jgi:hypothetical protein
MRRGLSLLEVLVSMGVLTLGLLGVAMLIPIGKFAMTETEKADRTGMCGRAGIRDVKVRRLLNTDPASGGWMGTPAADVNVVVIDPLGSWTSGGALNGKIVGGTTLSHSSNLARRGLANITSVDQADAVFRWQDDVNFVTAKDFVATNANPRPTNGDRPMAGGGGYIGNFSWFFTAVGTPSDYTHGIAWQDRRQFVVSVVVCYKRDFALVTLASDSRYQDPQGEQSWPLVYDATAINPTCNGFTSGFGFGGGTIELDTKINALDPNANHPINRVREEQWVMVVGLDANNNPIVGNWYRVVGVGRDLSAASQPVNMLTLVGPDWPTNTNVRTVNVLVVNGVTGVYTRTMQLDNDVTWSR